jgi:hypothetical protein
MLITIQGRGMRDIQIQAADSNKRYRIPNDGKMYYKEGDMKFIDTLLCKASSIIKYLGFDFKGRSQTENIYVNIRRSRY